MSTVAIQYQALEIKVLKSLEYFEKLREDDILLAKTRIVKRINKGLIHRICKFFKLVDDYTVESIPDKGWGLGLSDDITLTFAYFYKFDEINILKDLLRACGAANKGYSG